MAERKVSKPRVVRMWAVWFSCEDRPCRIAWSRRHALRLRDESYGSFPRYRDAVRVVPVEVREVKPRKSGKGKVKRGR